MTDPPPLTVGAHTYGHEGIEILHWGEPAELRIGRYCSISTKVTVLLGGDHRTDWITTYPFSALTDVWPDAAGIAGHPATKGDVVIGNDVWIGHDVRILSGVTIGDGAAIGAGSTVTRDVPPYAVVAGAPARVTRRRFTARQIRGLLAVAWWDWPDERVHAEVRQLLSGDVDGFLDRHAPAAARRRRLGDVLRRD